MTRLSFLFISKFMAGGRGCLSPHGVFLRVILGRSEGDETRYAGFPRLRIGGLTLNNKSKGTLYDADVVDACLRLFNEKRFKLERATSEKAIQMAAWDY